MTNNIQPLLALLTAHYAADFLFQTKRGIATKKWNSFSMISHIGVVFFLTFLFWQHFIGSLLIALAHWSIDIVKIYFLKDKEMISL